jgi:hypothetical protein
VPPLLPDVSNIQQKLIAVILAIATATLTMSISLKT